MNTIQYDFPLRDYNSFAIDARAARLLRFDSLDALAAALRQNPEILQNKRYILGGGNNTLFTSDFDGTIIHPCGSRIEAIEETDTYLRVRADAGVEWDDLVVWAIAHGGWGVENLSIIPGQVGAAPVQNIGAYGVEAKDVIESVEMLDCQTLARVVLAAEHCDFAYRHSIFKGALKGRVIITSVIFRLGRTPAPKLEYGQLRQQFEKLGGRTDCDQCQQLIRQAVIDIRRSKLPDPKVTGNAGSFFKNPVVDQAVAQKLKQQFADMPLYPAAESGKIKLAAGWLIEQSGWKGRALGRAAVHDRQALVLINRGGATADEIVALARAIERDVEEKFGIKIEPEVNIL